MAVYVTRRRTWLLGVFLLSLLAVEVYVSKSPTNQYSIVFDAGSTGTRVHVFCFSPSGALLEVGPTASLEFFRQVKPGLSAYRADVAGAQQSVRDLMDQAMSVVPAAARPAVELGATAGLRLIDPPERQALLRGVTSTLSAYPVTVGSVRILEASDEAASQWFTARVALGSAYVVDLGGGSMQVAYEADGGRAYRTADGQTVALYVHSFLGQGLMALRARFAAHESACFPAQKQVTLAFGGSTYSTTGSGCSRALCAEAALRTVRACGERCDPIRAVGAPAFRGAPVLSSYFVDVARQAGLIDADDATLRVEEYANAIDGACSSSDEWLALDLGLLSALLSELGLTEQVRLVKSITVRGHQLEMAWPLGLALRGLGASRR